MNLTNNEDEYGLIARFFHWAIAILIIGLLPVGLGMTTLENSPFKFQIYAMHKSFGMLVFFLGLARIVWRFASPPPDELETHKPWESALAGAAHFWLYVCVIGMPLSGWLMSSAGEFPIPFFGINIPPLLSKDENLAGIFSETHEILAYTLLFVLAMHVAGALKHHVIDKDETLQRMTFKSSSLLIPSIVVLVLGLSFGMCALLIAQGIFKSSPQEIAVPATATMVPPALLPDTSNLPEHGWAIVKEQSKLQFVATLYNAPFTGEFKDFTGSIIFNPDDLSTAKVDITINMKDVKTGDEGRDSDIKGTAWFDSENNPTAVFSASKFEKAEGNNYVAIGDLTLRGMTMPVILPFALEIQDNTARVSGKLSLNRLGFKMGEGEWADEKTVGHNVDVLVDVTAVR